ncbi:hypothetical protein EDD15DRAFT_2200655 [Pisolithus albus]|nr:hypothetical protein EDD15DRAFT_2200655 [Pisolithus albus]
MARTKQTARKSASGVAKPAQLAGRERPRTTSSGSAMPSSLSSLSPLSSPPPSPVLQEIMYLERRNRELEDILGSPEILFTCPACHEKEERVARSKPMPYFVSFFPSILARANMPRGLYTNEARKSMNARGSLPCVLNTALEEYHSESTLRYYETFFDFSTTAKLRRWESEADRLATEIGIDAFEQKIIFVTVHSEVTRGDLFGGKDGKTEMWLCCPRSGSHFTQFMEHLFSGRLRCFINGSTIFMLSCGPLVAFPESISSLKEAIVHLKPVYTIAFSAEQFISAVAKSFIIAFGVRVLIQGHDLYEVFNDLLDVSVELQSKASLGNTVKKARVSTCTSPGCGYEYFSFPPVGSYVVIKGGSRDSTGQGWIKHVGI